MAVTYVSESHMRGWRGALSRCLAWSRYWLARLRGNPTWGPGDSVQLVAIWYDAPSPPPSHASIVTVDRSV